MRKPQQYRFNNQNKVQQIKVKSNKKLRTFTIRKYDYYGNVIVKYRTYKQSEEDFNSLLNNTENDWFMYLKTDNDYSRL